MKKNLVFYIFILGLSFLVTACNKKQNETTTERLAQLDSLLDTQPQTVLDSLEIIRPERLSRFNTAYSQLLQTIADDKTDFEFQSDSLISSAVSTLQTHQTQYPELYARSLLYQGIVRYRMGVTDSTSYIPIKQSAHFIETSVENKNAVSYFVYYYLGLLFFENNNPIESINYLKKSLISSKHLGNEKYLFNSYSELAWAYLQLQQMDSTKLYIDTLKSFQHLSEANKIGIKHLEASYYERNLDHEKALKVNSELLNNPYYSNKRNLSKIYYKLSKNYKSLNDFTNALLYAERAVSSIEDTTDILNYHYYENIAEIAEKLQLWEKSFRSLAKSNELKTKLFETNSETKLLELERKYDLKQAENMALRYKNQRFLLFGVSTILLLIVCGGIILRSQFIVRKKTELKLEKNEKERIKLEKDSLEYEVKQKDFLLPIYHQISERNEMLRKVLDNLKTNSYIEANENILKKIITTYNDFTASTQIDPTKFFAEEEFVEFTEVDLAQAKKLNPSDKIMLIFAGFRLDNKQIAVLLNISDSAVRARKAKLRAKLDKNQIKLNRITL